MFIFWEPGTMCQYEPTFTTTKEQMQTEETEKIEPVITNQMLEESGNF